MVIPLKEWLQPILFFALCWLLIGHVKASERDYQNKWCKEKGGIAEYRLPDRTRVDCLTECMAVEFDFAHKWADGFGQAIWYGMATNRRGALALIVGPNDSHHVERVKKMVEATTPKIELILIEE